MKQRRIAICIMILLCASLCVTRGAFARRSRDIVSAGRVTWIGMRDAGIAEATMELSGGASLTPQTMTAEEVPGDGNINAPENLQEVQSPEELTIPETIQGSEKTDTPENAQDAEQSAVPEQAQRSSETAAPEETPGLAGQVTPEETQGSEGAISPEEEMGSAGQTAPEELTMPEEEMGSEEPTAPESGEALSLTGQAKSNASKAATKADSANGILLAGEAIRGSISEDRLRAGFPEVCLPVPGAKVVCRIVLANNGTEDVVLQSCALILNHGDTAGLPYVCAEPAETGQTGDDVLRPGESRTLYYELMVPEDTPWDVLTGEMVPVTFEAELGQPEIDPAPASGWRTAS